MGRIAFVSDSTAGIPAGLAEKYNIVIIPLQVIFGAETFRDGIDLTQDEFFSRLKSAKTLPTTSQPSTGDFEEAYKKLLDDPGVDSIISAHVSSKLSGTYGTACAAAERLGASSSKKITVIDSLSAYLGTGLLAINGARAAEKGMGHDEIVAMLDETVPRIRLLVLVDTLEYLQRGGRIGGAQAFLGTMLNIKPVLHLKDGRLEPLEKVRTRRKAMERLVEIGAQEAGGKPCQVCVGHAQAPEDAQTLTRMIREKMSVVEELSSELSPTVSVHTGPGVLGFVYCPVASC